MISAQLNQLELLETWAEEDPQISPKFAAAISAHNGSASTQLVYFTLEPGAKVGRHAHSADETLLVLEGTLEVSMGEERQQLSAGEVALIPAGLVHDTPNVGSETLRAVVFFPSSAVLHTWEVPLMPIGSRGFVTPPAEAAEDAEAAPVDSEAEV
jgi:quercetin dioxygenase-like cupin family protein